MSSSHVLFGQNNWLFLGEGTNFSISQMIGRRSIDDRVRARWRKATCLREAIFGSCCLTLICPEKSCIYEEFLPDGYKISPSRFSFQLSNEYDNVLYGLLNSQADKSEADLYPKTDTHFTEYGAFHVVLQCLKAMKVEYKPLHPEWIIRAVAGDLGAVLEPKISSAGWFLKNRPKMGVVENGLRNRGRAAIYDNAHGNSRRLLLYGDSFSGGHLARIFAYFFSQVIFVHTGSMDYELLERVEPDYIVMEYAERFMIEPPEDGRSFVSVIAEKYHGGLYSKEAVDVFLQTEEKFERIYGPAMRTIRRLL